MDCNYVGSFDVFFIQGAKVQKNDIVFIFCAEKHEFRVKKKLKDCMISKISLSLPPRNWDVEVFHIIICLLIKIIFYEQDKFCWCSC